MSCLIFFQTDVGAPFAEYLSCLHVNVEHGLVGRARADVRVIVRTIGIHDL